MSLCKDSTPNKAMDTAIAETLWPAYLESNGNIAEVHRQSESLGVSISLPTLHKLAENFGWAEKLAGAQKSRFSASVDVGVDLVDTLAEVKAQKTAIKSALDESPGDLSLHKLYGQYVGQILDIQREMRAARAVDKEQLLLDALNACVKWLNDSGHEDSANAMAQGLESIFYEIKNAWSGKK